MSVDDVYKICQYIVNKNQDGYLSPDEFNLIINQAQTSFLDYLLGEFQQYTPGRPLARVEFGQNETVRQRLTPVIYGYTLSINNTGFSPYPGDYQQADALWTIYGMSRIRYVQQDSLYSYINSVIDPVISNPIYIIEDSGFRFYPNTSYNNVALSSARLSYVRTPARIVWGYTLDDNGLPVYSAAASQDAEWYDTDMLEIIARALRMVGVNLQAQQVSQYAEEIKTQGQ